MWRSLSQFRVLEFPASLKLFRNPLLRVSDDGTPQFRIANGFGQSPLDRRELRPCGSDDVIACVRQTIARPKHLGTPLPGDA
ncbi:hypothetical protein ASE66_24450 [Bosea sp. Root483D1]|nr:hypothetical protein ASE66_24450 [Bosea sp. Root483D1]